MAEGPTYCVSVGNVGESDHNTIVLGGVDVVIPLEMDLDGDPLHDDEVRLRSADGSFERILLVSDPDVECDHDARIAHYRFRLVPYGQYNLATRIGAEWVELVHGLLVAKTGVLADTNEIDDSPADAPAEAAGPAARHDDDVPDEDALDPDDPLYLEQMPLLDDPELV